MRRSIRSVLGVWCILLLCQSAAADSAKEPLRYQIEPGKPFRLSLTQVTQLAGPFVLISAPEWVGLNARGTLFGTPGEKDGGEHRVELQAKSGTVWVDIKLQLRVEHRKYTLKIFTAPWCNECRRLLPALEDKLTEEMGLGEDRLAVEVYLETDYDLYEAPRPETAEQYRKDLNLGASVTADEWQWKEYRKYYPKGFRLPAAVLLSQDGSVVKAFGPGALNADVVAHTVSNVVASGTQGALSHLDILWVVDNSGSMQSYHDLLARHASALFDELAAAGVHWKMGMVTTDPQDPPALALSEEGGLHWLATNPAATFARVVQAVGITGNGVEQPFLSVRDALRKHPGFLGRSRLAVIVVTDEPDQSPLASRDYLQFLIRQKGHVDLVGHYGVISAPDFGCQATGANWAYRGSAFEEVIRETKGRVVSLCAADFAGEMRKLARALAGR